MNTAKIAVGGVLCCALGSACCLPMPRTTWLMPELTVRVEDPLGNPVSGAEVVLVREVRAPPPEAPRQWFVAHTDAAGEVRFQAVTFQETVMPLMMHGVPWIAFTACARGPAGRAVVDTGIDAADVATIRPTAVTLRLDPNGAPCPIPLSPLTFQF